MKKRLIVAALAIAGAMSLSGCGGSKSNTEPAADSTKAAENGDTKKSGDGKKILTIQLGPDVESIDPALNSAVDGANYILYAFENLLKIDKEGKVVPGLAEKYEISDDQLTWTFHLRDGLKWSDGSDFTAEDFVYSWQRMVDPNVAAPYAQTVLGMVEGYDEAIGKPDAEGNTTIDPDPTKLKVEAPDDKTLIVHMAKPTPYFDKLAAFVSLSPVKKDVVEANPDGWSIDPKTYISTGPFKLTEWKPGSYLMFEKNENYWDADSVKLDGIKCLLMEDQNAAFSAYESGDALMIKSIPTQEITTLKERADYYLDPILGTYYLDLNNTLDEFKDSRVREALSLALDRKYISEVITAGTYTPATGFVSEGVTDWDGTVWQDNITDSSAYINVEDHAGNLAKAKELLKEVGYENGVGLPEMVYSTNDASYHKKIAEYLQQAWGELGLKVEVNIVEWKSFTPQRRSGNYQIARDGWVMDYNDPSNILELALTGNGNNNAKYSNPEFDALMEKAATEKDPQTRFGYFHQAEDLMMKDTAMVPLLYYNDFYLQSDKITGSWHSPDGFWHFEYADIAE
ncbi:peptide ABC transporter substrate-binding protein [Lachnoanaerobaculum sp. Marseille-Q4761]|uniref:peptide ABC transporter substrate-binding protein n=1 Tax=Lachnoanaerobaculum sp. Marseille-Q4761 TaxID=2819511 RepID=UPI001AA10AC0|nr:peptide ABC transporter substrate-binding protein [Lachnoanaerobaculum sp. Marseille-Q4761]MBO1870327.1 peptide ABC transporter substrate-binding protein [Lachnoanaerobaculum sp. Marseille-Q4761]